MKTGFGKRCAAVRQGLGIGQEYMAKLLGLKSSKAFSRLEHDKGRYTDEQYDTAARALGFSSALSLQGFDLVKAIARYEAERASGAAIDVYKLLQENDGLKARLAEREADVERYKGVEQVLLDRIRNCEQGGPRP